MRRITVCLSDELKAALEHTARTSGRSQAESIREGVAHVAGLRERPQPRLPLFNSGDPSWAERADELLDGFDKA